MITGRAHRIVNIALVVALLAAEVLILGVVVPAKPAEAFFGPNHLVGLINVINASNRRRRLYNEARDTQGDMNVYYNSLIEEARNQLREQELVNIRGESVQFGNAERSNYIKLIRILETERAAVTAQIEAEKNAARQEFNDTLGQQVFNVIIKTPGGQKLLGDVRQTLDGLKQAAAAVQAALGEGPPSQQLLGQVAASVSDVAAVHNTVRYLGSELGPEVDQALGGILGHMDAAAADLQEGMQQAIDKANELDDVVAGYQEEDRTPGTIVVGDTVRSVDGPLGAAMEALANASFIAASIRPDDGTHDSMRDRIREALITRFNDRLEQYLDEDSAPGLVACERVDEATYLSTAAEIGAPIEKPADPETARYLVCSYTDTGEPFYAALIGQAQVATEVDTGNNAEEGDIGTGLPATAFSVDNCSCPLTNELPLDQERCSANNNAYESEVDGIQFQHLGSQTCNWVLPYESEHVTSNYWATMEIAAYPDLEQAQLAVGRDLQRLVDGTDYCIEDGACTPYLADTPNATVRIRDTVHVRDLQSSLYLSSMRFVADERGIQYVISISLEHPEISYEDGIGWIESMHGDLLNCAATRLDLVVPP